MFKFFSQEINGSMFIYGGLNISKKCDFSEVLKYSNGFWCSYATSAKPRFGHSCHWLNENQFLVIGGANLKKEKLESEIIQFNSNSVSSCSLDSNDLFFNDFKIIFDHEDSVFSNGIIVDQYYFATRGISISSFFKVDSLLHKAKLATLPMNKIIILGASESGKTTMFVISQLIL
jgi:hypothetical protein